MDTNGAGPSTLPNVPELSSSVPPPAPSHPLSSTHFYSIEYPGYVQPTSIPLAVERLGGQTSIETAFKRVSAKNESLLELHLRPGIPFAHPVPGDIVPTSNVLLKVIKRKRKRPNVEEVTGVREEEQVGEYTVEAVGVIPKTVRFRGMVDYQFQPDMNDPLAKLRVAMDNMDVESILKYKIPPEKEDYMISVGGDPSAMQIDPQLMDEPQEKQPDTKMKSNLRLFTPPLFSRQGIPQNYNYRANTASVVTTVVDEETGEEKKRLINRTRWKGYGPISILFSDKTVPDKPPATVEEKRKEADPKLLKKLEELFQERPIWTRAALFNQLAPWEMREVINSKFLLPLVSYVFQDGPWRDTQLCLGYDPRQDQDARFYQRLYFRNTSHPVVRPSITIKRQEGRVEAQARSTDTAIREVDRRSHIFDGLTVTKETAAFQLCDIYDPMLKEMIEDEDDVREVCNERDGWYSTRAIERIKTVLRHKFFSLLGGHVATREECEALLVPQEGTNKLPLRPTRRLKPGKHNMAKGALRPEDAAAQRLTAMIEQKAKDFQSQR
ncbi:hypothetical protein SCP_0203510 [Sparassis crispa]|uniref:Transcription factor tau subunit sfc1 n=1 Tax=Sparassis crispa TaxID=139825 RepID=A0A401GAG5_9APHY|nr:hypothetical protein SCP_0203510 [Sparassis crispa]GBE79154.1 hypothetical protein SCP_0203510 [Sparassis crispa]